MKADIIDEHYYQKPEWFLANAKRYDNYPRNGSKVFGGEYAAQSDKTVSIDNKNNWLTAISEAAFMTGLERNAAVVSMASYAPLFAHADGWQWTPDLIWVNNLQSYGTPNYYVQKLYSTNKGTNVVPALMDGQSVSGQDSIYVSAVIDKNTNEVIIKVVNASANAINKVITINGAKKLTPAASVTVLKGNSVLDVNSFASPEAVSPVASAVQIKGNKLAASLPAYSFSVYRVGMK
jgi:alpha-L-arabinofuranosidase